jgi:hypothetical protein
MEIEGFNRVKDKRAWERFLGVRDGFDIDVKVEIDTEEDFRDYGKFCEKEREDGGFFLRNPNVWRRNADGEWIRTTHRQYGWWKLANDPQEEVHFRMKGGMEEGVAWSHVLDRERETLRKIANEEITPLLVHVEASKNGIALGEIRLGSVYYGWGDLADADGDLAQIAREAIAEAVAEAKKALKTLCDCK